MPPTVLMLIMLAFLGYVGFRTVVYFRTGRPHFGIATTFVGCIVLFELVMQVIKLVKAGGNGP